MLLTLCIVAVGLFALLHSTSYIVSVSREDAADASFFQREVENVITRVWEEKRPGFAAFELIPITSELDPGAQTIVWQEAGAVGSAKIIANGGSDLPMVDVWMKENRGAVRQVGDKFSYTTDEIRAARMAGKSLDARKAQAARRFIEHAINQIAWFGDKVAQLPGLLSTANVTRVTPATAVASPNGTGWNAASGKTGVEIATDFARLVMAVFQATNGIEAVDTVILPTDEFAYINVTRLDTSSAVPMTILEYLRKTHPEVNIVKAVELADVAAASLPVAAAAAANVAVAYRRSDEVLRLEIPLQFSQLPPQAKDLRFEVPCEAKTAGCIVHIPLAIATMQGI